MLVWIVCVKQVKNVAVEATNKSWYLVEHKELLDSQCDKDFNNM